MRLAFFMFIYLLSFSCFCSDSTLIPKLFQNLLNKQIKETDFFAEGSFVSYRQHNNKLDLKADNNIFYTALIAYILQDLKPYFTKDEMIVADTIINRTKLAFPLYQNTNKRLSYNFWQTTNGGTFFPNDLILSKLKSSLALPDDLDDTGIILAALNVNDSIARKAHLLMQDFVNGKYSTIKNTYKKYKKISAYSTWYGVKMPVDFDFGVHCNILSFVNKYHLPWQMADSATYQLLLSMIDEKLYLKSPIYISPYYGYSPVLLYHIGRLMNTKNMNELENRKASLINDALNVYSKTDNDLYKIMLATTLLKWNVEPPKFELNENVANGSLNNTDFVYYTGHLFGHLNNTIKQIANKLDVTKFNWYCSAFNDCLVLEYLILKYRRKQYLNSGRF
jgi:hypothetical protein